MATVYNVVEKAVDIVGSFKKSVIPHQKSINGSQVINSNFLSILMIYEQKGVINIPTTTTDL